MADEIPQHRCETCGFLALRNRITGLLDEAPQEYRWRAEIPKFRNPSVKGIQPIMSSFYDYPYSGIPICLVRAYPLHNEFTNQEQATEKEIFGTLEKERDCADRGLFTAWKQGFTPKEHREMLDRQLMIEREDRRDKDMRDWQERQQNRVLANQWSIAAKAAIVGGFFVILAVGLQNTIYKPDPPVVNVQPPSVNVEPPVINNIIQLPTATPQPPTPEATVTPNPPPSPSSPASNSP